MKQRGFGGQTKPVFHKKAKTTKKPHLRNKCTKCGRVMLTILKNCKSFELIGNHQRKSGSKKDVIFGSEQLSYHFFASAQFGFCASGSGRISHPRSVQGQDFSPTSICLCFSFYISEILAP